MMTEPDRSATLIAALDYASRGLPVLPIKTGQKQPASQHGVKDATCLAPRIEQWWAKMPDCGVGIAGGGPARLVVIDVDGDDGRVSLASLEQQIGKLPVTATAKTPRGGEHRYFSFPARGDISRVRNSVGKLGKKIDIRAGGGYVVAPPTRGYEWIIDAAIAELPDAWATRLVDQDNSRYSNAALTKAIEAVRNAGEGQRNDTLNKEAFGLGQLIAGGALSEHVVREALVGAACAAGLSESEARATFNSGLSGGRNHPRTVPLHGGDHRSPLTTVSIETTEPKPWTELLRYDRRGVLSKDPSNAFVLLTMCPAWRGVFSWDSFADCIRFVSAPPPVEGPTRPPVGEALRDHHLAWVGYALSRLHGVQFATQAIVDAVVAAGHANQRHSVRDWITTLKWDGVARIDTWLSRYLGADDTPYVGKIGRWWLLSCVARIAQPGCQVDHMLVLEGPQGSGKSSAVRILGGEWYLGSLPDLRERKSAAETICGRWIVEIGELDALRGAAATRVKDFLSQTVDHFRPAYGRMAVTRPRECAFIATTNESTYLTDPTGARRFWPVAVKELLRERFAEDRDQIWAEAWQRVQQGEQWWPDALSEQIITEQQELRHQIDEWESRIAD